MNKVALITGITGQDGAYLAGYLLNKDYFVHGLKQKLTLFNTDSFDHLYQDLHIDGSEFFLHPSDMTDSIKPDITPRKLMDVSKLLRHGRSSSTLQQDGIKKTSNWFLRNVNK